ncbi:helicase-like protein, partial [Trifolium medium]|nr:helicase-like protein [Trifolium medium]
SEGYPIYRRRSNGAQVEKNGITLDNRSVVPYNPTLLLKYQAHMNMEWCNQSTSIKYLFKYINKGYDRIAATISRSADDLDAKEQPIDEIKQYLDYKYVSPSEACWRIFGFPIHGRKPAVERLFFHLLGQQSVYFTDSERINDVLLKPSVTESMFTSWFEANKKYSEARKLTYGQPKHVWMNTREWLSDGILYEQMRISNNRDLKLSQEEIWNLTLKEIERLLQANRRGLREFPGMPYPRHFVLENLGNRLIYNERNYDRRELRQEFLRLFQLLTGKTFMWNTLASSLRSKGHIVLTVASSGIASLLLPGGTTAHSKFKIPVPTLDNSTCKIEYNDEHAELLRQTTLIIWDEAPMAHKYCFE